MEYLRTIISRLFVSSGSRKGRTVRYMFPIFAGFAALLGAQLISSIDTSYIRLELNDQIIKNNEPFSIDVFAYAHEPVNAVDITLEFNQKKVKVTGVDRGQSVLTIWTEDPIITDKSVVLRGGTFRRGFLGEHKIATINLLAKDTGSAQVEAADVMLLAGDGQGTPVSTSQSGDSSLSLYVYDENTNSDDIEVQVKVNILTDLDGDGKVTLKDISAFMGDWSNRTRTHDFNGDGRMTFRDFSIILANFFFQ